MIHIEFVILKTLFIFISKYELILCKDVSNGDLIYKSDVIQNGRFSSICYKHFFFYHLFCSNNQNYELLSWKPPYKKSYPTWAIIKIPFPCTSFQTMLTSKLSMAQSQLSAIRIKTGIHPMCA